jgi:DNA primase
VVLVFDSDQAGAGAALRGDTLRTPVDLDFDLRVADLPGGMDPADLVQAGRSNDLAKAISDSRPLLQFRIEKEVRRHRITEPEGRARAIRNTSRLISRVSEPIARAEYVRFAAKEIGVDAAAIEAALRGQTSSSALAQAGVDETNLDPIQAELIRVLLANPQELSDIDLDRTWVDGHLADLIEAIEVGRKTSPAGTPIKLDDLPHQELVQRLAFDIRPLPSNPAEVVHRAEGKAIERQIKAIEVELQALDPASQQYSEHLRRLLGLQERRRGRE